MVGHLHHLCVAVTFFFAVGRLFFINGGDPRVIPLFVLPPIAAFAIARSKKTSRSTAWLAESFLVVAGAGVVLAAFDLLPAPFDQFPLLPRADNQLLSWYVVIYTLYFMFIIPPYALGRSLWHHRRGEPAELAPFICWLGLATWSLVFVAAIGAAARWLRQ